MRKIILFAEQKVYLKKELTLSDDELIELLLLFKQDDAEGLREFFNEYLRDEDIYEADNYENLSIKVKGKEI